MKLAANFGKLCVIPLDHILIHNIALQFFMGNSGNASSHIPQMPNVSVVIPRP